MGLRQKMTSTTIGVWHMQRTLRLVHAAEAELCIMTNHISAGTIMHMLLLPFQVSA